MERLGAMESWADEQIKMSRSRRHCLILKPQLSDVRVLLQKAREEKDLMACSAIEEQLVEMDEIHSMSSAMERLLLHTEIRIMHLTNEVLNYRMVNELRCGAVSQSKAQKFSHEHFACKGLVGNCCRS